MNIGEIKTFETGATYEEQALKIIEEAAEVFSQFDNSWTEAETDGRIWSAAVFDECADVIMATCNLLAKMGIEDFSSYMRDCEERQEARGRYEPEPRGKECEWSRGYELGKCQARREYEAIEKLRKQRDEFYLSQGWYIPHDVQEPD